MTTPNRLADPIAEITVTGTAMASAHGEAATSTTSPRSVHRAGSPTMNPKMTTSAASTRTAGTSGLAIRSARRARSPLRAWACSTRWTTVVSELSRPAAVASICSAPPPLIEPAGTASPGPTSTGMDSPVIAEVSMLLVPVTTTPSVATRSPGRTTRMSSSCRSTAGMVSSPDSREMVAVCGIRDSSARSPSRARSIARSSRASAMENRNASAAASPTCPSSTAPTAAIVISRLTPRRPRTSRRTAPGTKVQAPASRDRASTTTEAVVTPVRSRV